MRFIFSLDPHSIASSLDEALHIALQYFDRVYGSDASDHDKILLAEYDFSDTHEFPKAFKKTARVYLIKGSPNRGIAIARDLERYYSVSVDSLENYLRVYVLKQKEKISEFRELAYRSFLVSRSPVLFKPLEEEIKSGDYYIKLSTGPVYATVEIKPPVDVRSIEQRRPLGFDRNKERLSLTIPTFSVPFALYDMLEETDKNFLALLVRKVYDF